MEFFVYAVGFIVTTLAIWQWVEIANVRHMNRSLEARLANVIQSRDYTYNINISLNEEIKILRSKIDEDLKAAATPKPKLKKKAKR